MKRVMQWLMIAIAAFVIAGAAEAVSAAPTPTVSGHVEDAEYRTRLCDGATAVTLYKAGAAGSVYMNSKSVLCATDPDGYFLIEKDWNNTDLAAGDYFTEVTANGYLMKRTYFTLGNASVVLTVRLRQVPITVSFEYAPRTIAATGGSFAFGYRLWNESDAALRVRVITTISGAGRTTTWVDAPVSTRVITVPANGSVVVDETVSIPGDLPNEDYYLGVTVHRANDGWTQYGSTVQWWLKKGSVTVPTSDE